MHQKDTSSDRDLLRRSVQELTRITGCGVGIGGLTTLGATPLTEFSGARSNSMNGLIVRHAHGVGGLAVADCRPVAATHYRESATITHDYDREVSGEGIVSLLAVPVVVDRKVRGVLYCGHRVATQFGDSLVRQALAVSKSLSWELSVSDEVNRRLALIESEHSRPLEPNTSPQERLALREAFTELRELGRTVADPEVARRLNAIGARVWSPETSASIRSLSPREVDMIAEVALGRSNRQIATRLGLTEATVKGYLFAAMHKLNASTRYEAVIAARREGFIP